MDYKTGKYEKDQILSYVTIFINYILYNVSLCIQYIIFIMYLVFNSDIMSEGYTCRNCYKVIIPFDYI
jgi:hypothetical protein